MKKKIIAGVIAVITVAGGYYYFGTRKGTEEAVRYQTSEVKRGILISSVSGTGQVETADSIDLKPGASSKVVAVRISEGDKVKKGQLLVQLDSTDVTKAVRDAETNLESAKQKLEDLYAPPTELQLLQKENSLISAQDALDSAKEDLSSSFEEGYNQVADAFLSIPSIMSGLDGILYDNDVNEGQSNVDAYGDLVVIVGENASKYKQDAQDKYDEARASFDGSFDAYKASSRFDSEEEIEALLERTYGTARDISEAVKAVRNFLDYVENALTTHDRKPPSVLNSHKSSLSSYTGTANGQVSSLYGKITAIRTARDRIISSERTLRERELELEDMKAGPDESDIASQELAVRQREEDLLDAKERYADYVVYAPFDGLVAEVGAVAGQDISSGTVAVKLVSEATIADIQFNEVDVTGIQTGQKANITFDAVPDYSVTGEVVAVDLLGSTSQGVVSFGVTIAFDSDDARIKPGMSLSVNIITNVKENVLTVPNSAIKYQGDSPYVEVMTDGVPTRRTVALGVGNDLNTEVVDGVEEGDVVVASSSNGSSGDATGQRTNGGGFMVPGGGAMRIMR